MPIKSFVHYCQPVRLCVVLLLSVGYFGVQLVFITRTHSLTLLMAGYHMLCNIFALTGCIVTIKRSKGSLPPGPQSALGVSKEISGSETISSTDDSNGSTEQHLQIGGKVVVVNVEEQSLAKRKRREMKLRNTFGWTRIDILTMLIVCIILASLSFSLVIEALQTLVHIDHQDAMHLPLYVVGLGVAGVLLNLVTYWLIGGYTMHQGSFLHVKPNGAVVFNRELSTSGNVHLQANERQLSKVKNNEQKNAVAAADRQCGVDVPAASDIPAVAKVRPMKRQGAMEMLRDLSSTIFVIVCGVIVHLASDKDHTSVFIDPILSIFSCVLLVSLSYPYMQEACLILLQTIPGSINMSSFEKTLVENFPHIINYHDLHIWQLSSQKYVATVHIKFKNAALYAQTIGDVIKYFHDHNIAEVTVQPEFHVPGKSTVECLIQCCDPRCAEKVCCKDSRSDLREITTGAAMAAKEKEATASAPAPLEVTLVKSTPCCDSTKDTKETEKPAKCPEPATIEPIDPEEQSFVEKPAKDSVAVAPEARTECV